MNDIISTVLQSSLSLAILFLIYHAFLRKDTFFKTNRIYLLLAMLLSVCIPFINVSVFIPSSSPGYLVLLDPVIITSEKVQSTITENWNIFQVILIIYLTGVAIFSIRFIYQLTQLFFLIRRYGIRKKEGIHFVFTDKNFSPFSFFNLVFFNQADTESLDAKKIIAHERVHITQWHSLDLMLLEIITIIQWFNPFIWMYRHAIKTLHEYLADEGVLHSGVDVKVYRALLFSQSTGIQINDLTNNFSKSILKRRFMMMNKTKSTMLARVKLMFALPLAITMMLVISCSPNAVEQEEENKVPPPEQSEAQEKPAEAAPEVQEETQIFTVVEEMPEYPGGMDAMYKYMGETIKYPDAAKKNNISGIVYINFIVEKDGEVTNVNLLRGFDGECDKEALRVVREMPNWKPGKQRGKAVRVAYNMPVKFTLD
jgi:TonB family protein